jgi:Mg-chelatase subunit ChlD
VFVVDASASMQIRDIDTPQGKVTRFQAAVSEIRETLPALREGGDYVFDIVACSTRLDTLSYRCGQEGPIPLNRETESAAVEFLTGFQGGGLTRMCEAILWALQICQQAEAKWHPGTVILYTDGIPTFTHESRGPQNSDQFFQTVRTANTARVRINAYALSATSEGMGILKRLCRENQGILFVP